MDYSAKSIMWKLVNVSLVVAIVFGLVGIQAIVRGSNAVNPSRTIMVSGEGKVSVAPDIATASFSVVSNGTDPAAIQTANTAKINKVIEYLKSKDIAEKDITTTGYNLYPRYQYDKISSQSNIIGYELSQTVTVKMRNLAKVGEVMGGLTAQGVNQISQLSFSVENPEAKQAEARAEAFDQARSKAESMARANGVRIARVITFSESNGGYPMPYYDRMYAVKAESGSAAPVAPDIQPGEQDINVTVNVTYEIK